MKLSCQFIQDPEQEIEFQFFEETNQLVKPLIKERDTVYEHLHICLNYIYLLV